MSNILYIFKLYKLHFWELGFNKGFGVIFDTQLAHRSLEIKLYFYEFYIKRMHEV
tara:strand:+ start:264 stop:428 length:165 start_codon:yes stop_codon:yes gene_type:complete